MRQLGELDRFGTEFLHGIVVSPPFLNQARLERLVSPSQVACNPFDTIADIFCDDRIFPTMPRTFFLDDRLPICILSFFSF